MYAFDNVGNCGRPLNKVKYIIYNCTVITGMKYVCIRSYTPGEPDEVEMFKGALVTVLERTLDGWWLVK